VSIPDVLARMTEIQARFGVTTRTFNPAPTAGDFAEIAGIDDLPALAAAVGGLGTNGTGGVGSGASIASLIDALAVQRSELGLSTDMASLLGSPLDEADLTSRFGVRSDPFTGESRMHRGIDYSAPTGTPIRAAAPGVVTWAGEQGSYGELVIVDHGNGVETRYAHQAWVDVAVGDTVNAGDVIGAVGSTGRSTGPHLHFELRVGGEAIDPQPWMTGAESALLGASSARQVLP
jgi:murein DD-endopeptidase MepM/ murein hydrolase activator NlpD